ncbi:hypothetical protein BOX15_Mlig010463g1, partial [Macrostomum lignano]
VFLNCKKRINRGPSPCLSETRLKKASKRPEMEDPVVKLRRCKSARPDMARRSRTDNRWDPWDPVVQARILPLGTKHWSQMKAQATANCPSTSKKDTSVQFALPDNEKQQKSAGGGPEKFNRPRTAAEATTAAALPVAMDGLRIRRSPHPGSPSWLAKLNTGYNQRARQGFVYWFTGRPKPTQFGRYSTGAKHMQYGLGMAPRS